MDVSLVETRVLITQAQTGDRAAMEELFRRYKDPVLMRIRRRMGPEVRNVFESQDFLQDVFVEAVGSIKRFESRTDDSFLRWMATIVQNRVRDVCKRIRVVKKYQNHVEAEAPEPFHKDPTPSQTANNKEWNVRLNEAIDRLPESARVVIRLRDFENLEFEEIAARTGKSGYEAAKKSYWRAVRQLAKELEADSNPT